MSNPGANHYKGAKHAIRYLNGTNTTGLKHTRYDATGRVKPITVTAYCDSDYATDPDTRVSVGGMLVFVAGNLVAWQSKKQKKVALSTCEAEFYALTETTQMVLHIRNLLGELTFTQTKPTPIYCDNQSTVMIVNGGKASSKLKHVDVRHHFIYDETATGTIGVTWIPTTEQLADILTKSLDYPTFSKLRDQVVFKPVL